MRVLDLEDCHLEVASPTSLMAPAASVLMKKMSGQSFSSYSCD